LACQEINASVAVDMVIGLLLVVKEMFVSDAVNLGTGQHNVIFTLIKLAQKMKIKPMKSHKLENY
jgi:hypothetical protein